MCCDYPVTNKDPQKHVKCAECRPKMFVQLKVLIDLSIHL